MTRDDLARRPVFAFGFVAVVLGLLVSPVGATAGTLDQSQTNLSGGAGAVGASQQGAQTFTAGIAGGLDQVDVHIGRATSFPGVPEPVTCGDSSGLTAQIRTVTTGGTPSETVSASSTVAATAVPADSSGWVSIPFATPAAVSSGTRYAVVLVAPGATCTDGSSPYSWSFSAGNLYAAGQLFFRPSGGAWEAQANSDGAFRTYVVPMSGDGGDGGGGGGDDASDFSFGKVKKNKRKGTAKLTVNVPGPGGLALAKTKAIKADQDLAEAEGMERLSIRPRARAKKKLNSKGKAKVTAEVTYTAADGGSPQTEDKKIKLVKR